MAGLGLFLAALWVLGQELRTTGWHALAADLIETPPSRLLAALGLSAANYVALTGYDLLAFRIVGLTLPTRRIAATALIAYAVSNSIGLAALSGASVRYRFYSRWGVAAEDLSRIVLSYSLTFWIGILAMGGLSLAFSPSAALLMPGHRLVRVVGYLLIGVVAAYLAATFSTRRPITIRRLRLPMPPPALALVQIGLSAAEWMLAASVLYVLLPPGAPGFLTFLGVFILAILGGLASHVPGGVGVFEGLLVLLLRPFLDAAALVPSLVVYRALYYLLPFALAVVALVADEVRRRRDDMRRAGHWLGHVADRVTPRLLAGVTFLAGVVLLFSGATPAAPGRLEMLARILPLGIIETSHFLGSVAGAGLVVLSQGLARRLDAAYYGSALLIGFGMAASLLKGFDYEEAGLLLVVLLILIRARPAFDRRAAFFETRFSAPWIAAVAGVLLSSLWLGLFAFKHVDYTRELWWQFELHAEASRFLRASVGAAVVVLLTGVRRLLGHAPHETSVPTDAELLDAEVIVRAQPASAANLVFLRDKAVLFDDRRDGFVMYGVRGRTWVAMGDPVGPEAAWPDLISRFVEHADDYGGSPAFYEISARTLHHYADEGFGFVKLGEEAVVDLLRYSLEGGRGARHRRVLRDLERQGCTFRIVQAEAVPAVLSELRSISRGWLARKASAEKGFSLGFFDDSYLVRFPVAVIERAGRIEAFANIWTGAGQWELSVDLMRYRVTAPRSAMEGLLVHLVLWGRDAGYTRFSLGMAPLSGVEDSPVAPLWYRVGAFVYEHGEAVYGFQGLRAFKARFDPDWEPRYLAYQGGLRLPQVLADIAALIAGGYTRLLLK